MSKSITIIGYKSQQERDQNEPSMGDGAIKISGITDPQVFADTVNYEQKLMGLWLNYFDESGEALTYNGAYWYLNSP